MSEKFIPKFTPFLASDVVDVNGTPGWASRVKAATEAHAHQIRVGKNNEIEACSPVRKIWQPIMLPHGGTAFADANEAAAVLRMLTGEDPIPNVVKETTE